MISLNPIAGVSPFTILKCRCSLPPSWRVSGQFYPRLMSPDKDAPPKERTRRAAILVVIRSLPRYGTRGLGYPAQGLSRQRFVLWHRLRHAERVGMSEFEGQSAKTQNRTELLYSLTQLRHRSEGGRICRQQIWSVNLSEMNELRTNPAPRTLRIMGVHLPRDLGRSRPYETSTRFVSGTNFVVP